MFFAIGYCVCVHKFDRNDKKIFALSDRKTAKSIFNKLYHFITAKYNDVKIPMSSWIFVF